VFIMLSTRRKFEFRSGTALVAVIVTALFVAAFTVGCSAEDDDPTPQNGDIKKGTGGLYGTGGFAATGGVPVGGNPPGTGGLPPPATGGVPPLGTGGDSAGGGPQGAGGDFPVGGTAGGGGQIVTGTGGETGVPKGAPTIPPAPTDCPTWKTGSITYKSLAGIQIAAGAKAAGPTAPMLIYWHGTISNSGEFAGMAGAVSQGVQSQGGLIVSFQGTTGGDLLSGTNIFGKGDLNLIDGLVACGVKDHNIDPRRIFTMGCSAGGLMSAATAALRSSYIAAAAPNSGGFTVNSAFQDKNTPALMTVHGKAGQDVVVIDFSQSSATADKAYKAHGSFVINCDHGGGHCGGGPLAGDVWKFFQAHPFGVNPEPWATALPAGFNPVCKIFQ
jgi:hypothetical protein